jgi:ATP-dependent Clp protease adaptor protein ClpS
MMNTMNTLLSRQNNSRPNEKPVTFTTEQEVAEDIALESVTTEGWNLVLYNDEHNTFDHVIDMLISICKHDALQAEQCALMVHFKGKCSVMTGTYDELEPKCTKLLNADLTAEIEA